MMNGRKKANSTIPYLFQRGLTGIRISNACIFETSHLSLHLHSSLNKPLSA